MILSVPLLLYQKAQPTAPIYHGHTEWVSGTGWKLAIYGWTGALFSIANPTIVFNIYRIDNGALSPPVSRSGREKNKICINITLPTPPLGWSDCWHKKIWHMSCCSTVDCCGNPNPKFQNFTLICCFFTWRRVSPHKVLPVTLKSATKSLI